LTNGLSVVSNFCDGLPSPSLVPQSDPKKPRVPPVSGASSFYFCLNSASAAATLRDLLVTPLALVFSVRTVLIVTATTAVGMALLSCAAPEAPGAQGSPTPPMGYGARAQVDRAPLAPPVGYASPSTPTSSNKQTATQTADQLGWSASPRWAAVKGKGCIEVEQDPQTPAQRNELKPC
jgi:hypothetical protein